MPALRFAGRAWLVAGDDLAVPFGVGAVLRAGGLGVLAGFAFSFALDVTCPAVTCAWLWLPGVGCVLGYVALSLMLMVATGLLQAGIAMSASKGTIMNDSPRHALPTLLLVYTLCTMVELLLTIWAVGSFWQTALECEGGAASPGEGAEAAEVLRGVVWLQVICCGSTLLGIGLCFDLSGSVHIGDVARLNRRWEARCKTLCCLATQDSSAQIALRSLVNTLSNLFAGLDLVPTDGLAACLLVSLLHREEDRDDLPDRPPESSTDAYERLLRASEFAPYASASYGWWLQTWRSCLFCKGAMRQARACASCACVCSPERYPRWVNRRALAHELTGRDFAVLLECPAQNFRPAFFIVADWTHSALVVTIRGTFSFADALTDGTAHTCVLPFAVVDAAENAIRKASPDPLDDLANSCTGKCARKTCRESGVSVPGADAEHAAAEQECASSQCAAESLPASAGGAGQGTLHEEGACMHDYGHAGIAEAARRVTALLHHSGLLPALLSSEEHSVDAGREGGTLHGHDVYDMLRMAGDEVYVDEGVLGRWQQEAAAGRTFNLVIVGHSLGMQASLSFAYFIL